MADTALGEVRKSAAREVAVLRERLTDAIDDVLDDRNDELADRLVEAALSVFDDAAIERMAQHYVDDTHIRSMEFRNGAELELVPAQDMVAAWVATARTMLGDAPNYSETRVDFPAEKVEMELKLAGEMDRYVFTVQRAGKLTPHEARVKAEQERDRLRAELETARQAARAEVATELNALIYHCPAHDALVAPRLDPACPGCQRHAALVGVAQLIAGHESPSVDALRERRLIEAGRDLRGKTVVDDDE